MRALLFVLAFYATGCTTLGGPAADEVEESLKQTQMSLAVTQLDSGKAEKAFATIQPLLKKFPDDARILTLAGMIHLSLSNNEIALNLLRKSYQLEPKTATALNLSSALIGAGKYLKARNVLRKILGKDKEYVHRERLMHNMGLAYEKDGKVSSAIKYYKMAVAENPAFYLSLFQLAKVYKEQGQDKLSRGYLGRAIRSCQSCYDPVHTLATMHMNDGQPKRARRVIENFLKSRFSTDADKKTARLMLKAAKQAESMDNRK